MRVTFFNSNGQAFAPTSARWRLRDVTNKRVIQDWTSFTPSDTTEDIEIPASMNEIYDDRQAYQEHAFAIQAEPGADSQFSDEVRYKVKNLKAFK
jgi:hypothetical protein